MIIVPSLIQGVHPIRKSLLIGISVEEANVTRSNELRVVDIWVKTESMTVKEQLEKLADNEGEMTIVPQGNDEHSLRAFQGEVRRLRALADEEIIEIVGQPHQESRTGKRYIDRVRVGRTASGDELREALRDE